MVDCYLEIHVGWRVYHTWEPRSIIHGSLGWRFYHTWEPRSIIHGSLGWRVYHTWEPRLEGLSYMGA